MTSEERQQAREAYFCEASRKGNRVVVAAYQTPQELVFDFAERQVEGTDHQGNRVRLALDRLQRFELDRVTREGDDKEHHYNYLLLDDGEHRLVYVERAPEYAYEPGPDTPRHEQVAINLGALARLAGFEASEPFALDDVKRAFKWPAKPEVRPGEEADPLADYLKWLGWKPKTERTDGREVLEYESFLERLLTIVAGALGVLSALYLGVFFFKIASGRIDLTFLLASLVAFAASSGVMWVRFRVQIHYLLDIERKQVLLCRNLLGFETTSPVARFADLECVTESGVQRSEGKGKPRSWHHALFLVLKDGRKVRVSDYVKQGPQTGRLLEVNELARRLEVPARPVSAEDLKAERRQLKTCLLGEGLKVEHGSDNSGLWGCLIVLVIVLAAVWMQASYGP
ncbi:hypothetical protein DYH09_24365 [bacterium CPR1]|nr:hypothetical protein [bacterium CPR1]